MEPGSSETRLDRSVASPTPAGGGIAYSGSCSGRQTLLASAHGRRRHPAAAAWLFGKVVEDEVTDDLLTVADEWLAAWLNQHATAGFHTRDARRTWLALTVVTGVSLATAVSLVSMRRRHWLLALVLIVPGGALLNELVKIVFQGARPTFDHPILTVTGYSFPSGHTMIATLPYGFLAVFLSSAGTGERSVRSAPLSSSR